MILLLGASGYIGRAFLAELQQRKLPFQAVSRAEVDYTSFAALMDLLRGKRPEFLINAAGFTGKPNVDACEELKTETLQGNCLYPSMLAHACHLESIPWGHVSSGCIYSGAKVLSEGTVQVEKDLTKPRLRQLFEEQPGLFRGFSEEDAPNFTFRSPPCSFYSGSKALGEESILSVGGAYVWRLRIPFDEWDDGRNYLSKLQRYPRVYDNINSISHRGDFVRACLDLWERKAPFGIYNLTNPGAVSARFVVQQIQRVRRLSRSFEFWENDAEFYRVAAKAPRSNCILDCSKLIASGVRIRPVEEALEESLEHWKASDDGKEGQ